MAHRRRSLARSPGASSAGCASRRLAERTGTAELLRKAELPPAERLVASAVFWVLFLGFLLAGLDALGFNTLAVAASGGRCTSCRGSSAPLVILAVGLVLANVVWRIVLLAAVNAGWPSARLVGGAVYFLMVTIAVAMALDHVGLARPIVLTAFAIVVGAADAGPRHRDRHRRRAPRPPPARGAPGRRARPESDGSSHL